MRGPGGATWRILGQLAAAALALATVLVAIAFLLPRDVTVTRQIVIDAPPAAIFPHLDSLRVGDGRQEIIVREPDQRVEAALDLPGVRIATAWLALTPEPGGTRVTWGIQADMGPSPLARYRAIRFDRRIGPELEQGLAALAAQVGSG